MEIDSQKLYAVITGDVVDSTKLNAAQREALYQVLREGSQVVKSWLGDAMPLPVDIFAGDRWQVLLESPGQALAAGLLFRAFLRSVSPKQRDTRFVVAIGRVDFVPGEQVSEGDGEAFRLSGQSLDQLKKRRMGFVTNDPGITDRWDLAFELIDAIAIKWSEKQALAIRGAIQEWTQEDIGNLWDPPIEQATVNRHLKAAGWSAIERAILSFRQYWTHNRK